MLNEERIRKMIRLSDYENGLGSTDLKRTHYEKGDYLRLQIMKTFFSVLTAMVLLVFLLTLYNLEYVLSHVLELPYREILIYGGGVTVILEGIALYVTAHRAGREYDSSWARAREYVVTLQELEALYEEEEGQEEQGL